MPPTRVFPSWATHFMAVPRPPSLSACPLVEAEASRHQRAGRVPGLEPDFDASPGVALREAFIDSKQTTAYRRVHGAGDGRPGWYVDRLGDFMLASRVGADADPAGARMVVEAGSKKAASGASIVDAWIARFVERNPNRFRRSSHGVNRRLKNSRSWRTDCGIG